MKFKFDGGIKMQVRCSGTHYALTSCRVCAMISSLSGTHEVGGGEECRRDGPVAVACTRKQRRKPQTNTAPRPDRAVVEG